MPGPQGPLAVEDISILIIMSTTTLEKPNTGLQTVNAAETGATIVKHLNKALPFCQKFKDLAINAFTPVLDTIEANGMNADLDKMLNELIIKGEGAVKQMNEKRSPATQIMRQIAGIFTGLENDVTNVITTAKNHRNAWAKTCAEEEKKRTAELLRKQNIEKEKISLKAEIEKQFRATYQNKLLEFKQFYTGKLNNASLDNFEKVKETLNKCSVTYPRYKFYELNVNVSAVYLDKTELAGIIFDTKVALYDELSANFTENMEAHKQSLIDQLPSKKAELERIAKASADQAKIMQEQAKQRQQEEEKRLREQSEAALKADQQNIELKKQMDVTSTLFDTQTAIAEVKSENTAKSRQGYKITCLSQEGYGAIFLFWFDKEGQKMKVEDMGKKSLDQMKTFCEKYAHKHGEKIANDQVIYEEDYKAVTVKDK